jgi:hypothetical protein
VVACGRLHSRWTTCHSWGCTVSHGNCTSLQSAHLLCPMRSNRGLPSPALLLGIRPVWYCGGNSCGGCSAFGRSCRKRSMVNCARGSNSDELAEDFACNCWAPSSSASLRTWREPSPGRGADGRRAMMRDSMRNSMCTGYSAGKRE